jgi:hypothetical protein
MFIFIKEIYDKTLGFLITFTSNPGTIRSNYNLGTAHFSNHGNHQTSGFLVHVFMLVSTKRHVYFHKGDL